jgi:uncharacterized glyoxalase superfamily protein PhnB
MADRPPKSEGMNWMNPYLIVKDMKGSLEFYEKAFGFETRFTMPDKDGNLMHAEVSYKDNVFMIGSEEPEMDAKAPATLGGSPVGFYIYVENVDKAFEHAKNEGAKVVTEPKDQFWGDRTCSFRCPEGHKWTLAQNVGDFDPNNVPG